MRDLVFCPYCLSHYDYDEIVMQQKIVIENKQEICRKKMIDSWKSNIDDCNKHYTYICSFCKYAEIHDIVK